jgi:hypothetical protein
MREICVSSGPDPQRNAGTASWTTYRPKNTSAPTTLKPRGPSRSRLNHEAGIKPETVHRYTRRRY